MSAASIAGLVIRSKLDALCGFDFIVIGMFDHANVGNGISNRNNFIRRIAASEN